MALSVSTVNLADGSPVAARSSGFAKSEAVTVFTDVGTFRNGTLSPRVASG